MKKWLLGLAILVAFAFIAGYFFLPRQFTVSKITYIDAPASSTYRFLSEPGNRKKWLPGATTTGNTFSYNGDHYAVTSNNTYSTIGITIRHKDSTLNSKLTVFSLGTDSVAIQWQCVVYAGAGLLQRVLQYAEAGKVKQNMMAILQQLQIFMSKTENVYGAPINTTSTLDTLLVATRAVTTGYPSTNTIYDVISKLKTYIIANGAMVTGHPLLNVNNTGSNQYQIMVALPTSQPLKSQGAIEFKKMVPGNFLLMEVTGGDHITREAIQQLQLYLADRQKTSMAIPFEVLVTDRMAEPDTSKWVTKIYQPVYK